MYCHVRHVGLLLHSSANIHGIHCAPAPLIREPDFQTDKCPSVCSSALFREIYRMVSASGTNADTIRVISRLDFQFSVSNSIKSRFANEGSIDRDPVLEPF